MQKDVDPASGIRIRPMRAEDRNFILSLTYRLVEFGSPTWRNEDKMIAFHQRYTDETADDDGHAQAVLVAIDSDGVQLGVVHVIRSTDFLTGEEQGYLSTIAVAAGADGRLVGSALMDAASNWTREQELRILALDVFAVNHRAREFYRGAGFKDETVKMVKEV